MTGWTSDLAHGLALVLAACGVGTYRPTGLYQPGETGIVIATVRPSPPRVVALTPYPLTSSPDADEVIGLQVRVRAAGGDPREAYGLDDAVRDALDGATGLDLDRVHLHRIERTGGGPIGLDDNGRAECVGTYQLTAHHPTRYRA
ncbi:minor capsid protein [Saccharopolyspora sp. 6V]|uniref:minor capsid protein n=1 Tax=Saccharopolyspora sp. 6V TaxID=2877239 RepID=UPI001CD52F28|nr:minor capsid protein [Saccharopolyspora sp. 6V]MCA1195132.1 minor capsid protein [Saccharopolyspora sp. 6V]